MTLETLVASRERVQVSASACCKDDQSSSIAKQDRADVMNHDHMNQTIILSKQLIVTTHQILIAFWQRKMRRGFKTQPVGEIKYYVSVNILTITCKLRLVWGTGILNIVADPPRGYEKISELLQSIKTFDYRTGYLFQLSRGYLRGG